MEFLWGGPDDFLIEVIFGILKGLGGEISFIKEGPFLIFPLYCFEGWKYIKCNQRWDETYVKDAAEK